MLNNFFDFLMALLFGLTMGSLGLLLDHLLDGAGFLGL